MLQTMLTTAAKSATTSAAFQVEVAVIGAGAVGLAIARSLAQAGKEVLILERGSYICTGMKLFLEGFSMERA